MFLVFLEVSFVEEEGERGGWGRKDICICGLGSGVFDKVWFNSGNGFTFDFQQFFVSGTSFVVCRVVALAVSAGSWSASWFCAG